MRTLLTACLFFCFSIFAQSQDHPVTPVKETGFKIDPYWFILIRTGSKTDFDSATRATLFTGHMANMKKLHDEGILKVAGPFGLNDKEWRGIFIFDCKTREEAEKYVSTDPAIAAGLFAVDIVQWYGEPSGSFMHGKPDKKN